MLAKVFKDLGAGLGLYYVWIYQAYHDITAKYKRTVLGTFWIAGGMVVTSVSMSVIFGALFHMNLRQALPYIMAGILTFSLTSYIFYDGAEMFMTSGGIIKNHAYPFTFYAFHTLCKSFFLFLHNLVVYWLFMVIIGAFRIPHWTILLSLPLVLICLFFWGMLSGMVASRFRDMRFMLPYTGQMLSTLTPVFWRADTLHGAVLLAVRLNPMYDLIQLIRDPLLGQAPDASIWGLSLAYTGVGIVVWLIAFSLLRRRIPFWV